jgi:hypothetical protein
MQIVEVCKFPVGSKARSLVLITAWAMSAIPGVAWQTGALAGPIISGFYASIPELGPISFIEWAKVCLVPISVITLLTLILGYIFLKPEERITIKREVLKEEYTKLGAPTFHEKVTAIVLGGSFLLFATGSIHHIPDIATCLIALVVLNITGCLLTKDISSGISWDLIIFVGTAMAFAPIFGQTGITKWLSTILVGALAPITTSPWLFVSVVLLCMFVWRFVDIATFVPTMAIISAIAPRVLLQYNINPHIWIPLLCIALNSFFLSYTNLFALAGEAQMGGKGWTTEHLALYGTGYFLASMIGMIIAIPYWISLGFFG